MTAESRVAILSRSSEKSTPDRRPVRKLLTFSPRKREKVQQRPDIQMYSSEISFSLREKLQIEKKNRTEKKECKK